MGKEKENNLPWVLAPHALTSRAITARKRDMLHATVKQDKTVSLKSSHKQSPQQMNAHLLSWSSNNTSLTSNVRLHPTLKTQTMRQMNPTMKAAQYPQTTHRMTEAQNYHLNIATNGVPMSHPRLLSSPLGVPHLERTTKMRTHHGAPSTPHRPQTTILPRRTLTVLAAANTVMCPYDPGR